MEAQTAKTKDQKPVIKIEDLMFNCIDMTLRAPDFSYMTLRAPDFSYREKDGKFVHIKRFQFVGGETLA